MLDARFQLQAAQVRLLRQTERFENWVQSVAHARHRVVFDQNGNSAKAGRTLVEEKATGAPYAVER